MYEQKNKEKNKMNKILNRPNLLFSSIWQCFIFLPLIIPQIFREYFEKISQIYTPRSDSRSATTGDGCTEQESYIISVHN